MKEQKFNCCDKLKKGSAAESECGSISAKIFLETWNTKSTAQYNFCEVEIPKIS